MSFIDITSNPKRCANIVNATSLQADVKAGLPNFGYYTPDINDDSHNEDLDYSGKYLAQWIANYYTPYAKTTWAKTLLMVTFDEDDVYNTEGNHIVAFFINTDLKAGTDNTNYTHYSTTKFVEVNFGLGNLGQNDVTANEFSNSLINNTQSLSHAPSSYFPVLLLPSCLFIVMEFIKRI